MEPFVLGDEDSSIEFSSHILGIKVAINTDGVKCATGAIMDTEIRELLEWLKLHWNTSPMERGSNNGDQ